MIKIHKDLNGLTVNPTWRLTGLPISPGFTIPFNIEQKGRLFRPQNNWRVTSLAPVTIDTLYVDPAGDDANDGSTPVLAKRTLENAIGVMTQPTTIWMADGLYGENTAAGTGGHWRGANPAYDCQIKAINPGNVISSPHVYQLVWSVNDAPTHTYEAPYVQTILGVWDGITPTSDGDYVALTLQANVAGVRANPGSYYSDGAKVYVHTTDERAPDADVHVFRDMLGAYVNRDNITVYVEGLELQGGTNAALWARNATAAGGLKVYAYNCKFKYSWATGGFACEGTDLSISQSCISARNSNDGFNYHVRNGVIPEAIEIDCIGRYNGSTGDDDNNASSIHDGGDILRIGGDYHHSYGPNIIDIDDGISINLGVLARSGIATTVGERINFNSAGNMYLWSCESQDVDPAGFDLRILAGKAMHTRELIEHGQHSIGGGATLDTF